MQVEVAAMSNAHALDEAAARGDSDLQLFYRRCTLLVTGGTGFMGKQLLEKMFRACDISKVFLLLRPKNEKSIKERVTEMLQDPCFDRVRKLKPDFSDNIIPIEGDVTEIRLGLSDQNWKTMSNEVDVIFHLAATTRFDESLRVATLINVRGTREALLLGRACRKLKSFVHVSTAYTQAVGSFAGQTVLEEFRTNPISPEKLIDLVESTDEGRLERYTDGLLAEYPNTYSFCKAVAEDLVKTIGDGLPICIVRPGIVVASYREPKPGWLDASCAYGGSGILEIVHVMFMSFLYLRRSDNKLAFVPCDYVNNAILVAGKETSLSHRGEKTMIYAVIGAARNPMLSGDLFSVLEHNNLSFTPKAVYYYYVNLTVNRVWFCMLTFFLHMIPANFADIILLLFGKEPRMFKIYKKCHTMLKVLKDLQMNLEFDDNNLKNLQKSLSKSDIIIFNFDVENIDWQKYLQILWTVSIRKYFTKHDLRKSISGKRHQFWFRILNFISTALYFIFLFLFCMHTSCIVKVIVKYIKKSLEYLDEYASRILYYLSIFKII